MLYLLYSILGNGAGLLLFLIAPLIQVMSARYGYGLAQRLGAYPDCFSNNLGETRVVWVHASSVGEVQAALILLKALLASVTNIRLVLTTTTEQGHKFAKNNVPASVTCLMAPLDSPLCVRRALRKIQPAYYICLETELWPVMLHTLSQFGTTLLLLNGRISERSFRRYCRIDFFLRPLLQKFSKVSVLTESDRKRYQRLGVPADRLSVNGNLKYDMPTERPLQVRTEVRRRLAVTVELVLICGSTHEGEERLLLEAFALLQQTHSVILVLAPRHLERVEAVATLLQEKGLAYKRYSTVLAGQPAEGSKVVLVDTMGDLAWLYGGGDVLFCGGSLVPLGGHNILEAARWGRPVFFGPHMKDFADAAELLQEAGGGLQVQTGRDLAVKIEELLTYPDAYQQACEGAARVAVNQRGAVARQLALLQELLPADCSAQ